MLAEMLPPDWQQILSNETTKPYFFQLDKFIQTEYSSQKIYPPKEEIFRAFQLCSFEKVKAVIIGQDPYHNPGQAHGLCFSVLPPNKTPPSLRNIFKEISSDMDIPAQNTTDLSNWAKQGVFLINAILTVMENKPGSHKNKGWENFLDGVIRCLSKEKTGLVFFLWGSFAQQKEKLIDTNRHLVLKAPHPSPLSAHRGFFGCKHFSQANTYLLRAGREPINWLA